jgi:hypothetical protein
MQVLTDDEIVVLKLRVALDQAPRPTPNPTAEWMITYMDWFFQQRISALKEAEPKPSRNLQSGA